VTAPGRGGVCAEADVERTTDNPRVSVAARVEESIGILLSVRKADATVSPRRP